MIAFEGDGVLMEYPAAMATGWLPSAHGRAGGAGAHGGRRPVKTDKAEASAKPARRSNKLSYNETRELERLPDDIAELEAEQAALQKPCSPGHHKTDPKQAHEWQLRVNEIDTLLLDKLARWDELESRAS